MFSGAFKTYWLGMAEMTVLRALKGPAGWVCFDVPNGPCWKL